MQFVCLHKFLVNPSFLVKAPNHIDLEHRVLHMFCPAFQIFKTIKAGQIIYSLMEAPVKYVFLKAVSELKSDMGR